MARDLVSITKRSRREKVALHPKAERILVKRNYAPGDHGSSRGGRNKASQYAVQLREKQKVKRTYGLLEKQFARLVVEASKASGVAGETLLQLLECRLDNVIYRLGFVNSRQAARQMVTHGHILLNGQRVDVPSIRVKPGDEISVRPKSKSSALFTGVRETLSYSSLSSSWLSLNTKTLTAKVTGLPTREEIDQTISEQLIIEFYSR